MDAPRKPVTRVLAYLEEPERSAMRYERLAEQYSGVEVSLASTPEEAYPALEDAEVLITIGNQLGDDAGAIYKQAKNLKWVQSSGTGVDNISGHPDLPEGVTVTRVHGLHGPQISEAAFAGMLAFARHIPDLVRNQDRATWAKPHSRVLCGATVGIFGLGAIANDLAPRCRAFGMRVVGITGTRREVPGFDRIFTTAELEEAVAQLDYLVVLTPHTEKTHHIINAKILAAMREDAVFVNLSRGGVVDEAALLGALNNKAIAGAALDVFEKEPLPEGNPFWSHPRVFVTPHAGGFHTGYPELAFSAVVENLARYLEGGVAALHNKV